MSEPPNIKEQKKKKLYEVGNNRKDIISEMPDEIVVDIISRLSVKEAQCTSVLSRRWRYMWAYSTNLDFEDTAHFIRFLQPEDGSERLYYLSKYADWVSSVVHQHRGATVNRFRVSFKLSHRACVHEWIIFAMRKGVQFLELDLPDAYHSVLVSGCRYRLSKQVLGIRECPTSNALSFKFLKDACFDEVDIDQDVVEYFIYNCPVLERVAVRGSSVLFNLRVVGQSIALKHLTIEICSSLNSIQLCDTNLVSYTYCGDLKKLVLRNTPLLVDLSLSFPGYIRRHMRYRVMPNFDEIIDFSYLSCCLSKLEILRVHYMVTRRRPVVPLLSNLKCLEYEFEETEGTALNVLSSYIKQTPSLHTLIVKFQSVRNRNPKSPFVQKRASRCCHDGLKVVKFVKYTGFSRQIELVKYLMKTASNLEKIIFDPVDHYQSEVSKLLFPVIVDQEELSRVEARKLKEKLPSTLDVVCL